MKFLSKTITVLFMSSVLLLPMSFAEESKEVIIDQEQQSEALEKVIEQTNQLNALLDASKSKTRSNLATTRISDETKAIANSLLGKKVYETKSLNLSSNLTEYNTRAIGPNYQRGEEGNYLVTTDGWVGNIPLPGHAGIVHSSNLTIESFADGVHWHLNDWDDRYDKVFEYRVNYAGGEAARAVQYAEKQIGDPYNYIFFDVWNESKFYCSQLVWRSWYEQGRDLDGLTNGVVAPVDLTHADNATIIYSSLW